MTLVAGVDSSTQSCKVVIRDADTGALVRQGRAPHPDGTEVDPAAWWDGAAGGDRRRPAGSTTSRRSPSAASSTAWSASTTTGEVVRPRCCGTTPARAGAAADLDRRARRRAGAGPRRSAACRSRRSPSPSCAGCAEHEPDNAARDGRGLPAARLADLAAAPATAAALGRRCVTDRCDASGTGYWSPASPASTGRDLLERALGRATSRCPGCSARREPAGHGRRPAPVLGPGAGDNAAAALGLGAGAGRRGRLDRHVRASSARSASTPDRATRPARSPASPTPPGELPAAGRARSTRRGCSTRPPRLLGVDHDELGRAGAGRAGRAPAGWCWCRTSRASARRTGPTPPARCTA